ncbi:hypothetical protein EON62_05455 [archaeon]|nr:MAG: hypothetical protein EON62_05455 [archaeon]
MRTLFTSSYVRPVAAEEYSKKHGGVSLQPLQFQMVGASDVLRNVDIADVPERRRAARERQLVALHDAVQIVEDTMRNVYLHAPLRPKFDSVYIYEDKFVSPFIVDDSAVI